MGTISGRKGGKRVSGRSLNRGNCQKISTHLYLGTKQLKTKTQGYSGKKKGGHHEDIDNVKGGGRRNSSTVKERSCREIRAQGWVES